MTASQAGLLALLHRANQIATEKFAAALGDSELTPRQVQVLSAIEAHEGASQTRIVELTGVDRSTLADIMRRLQKHKLIERRRSKADARAYVLKLSDTGRKALARGRPAIGDVEKHMLSVLPAAGRGELLAMLAKIVQADDQDGQS